ncbi:hypothetical protein [Glutamicibacter arilaitensis]|uniref:Uncharacterized protein n=1 Tax=Glutamicibacter arilaitensis TaxID=256701 RepID=A0A2N7S4W2_9MICC|nr:hypothetical protein [Glutamicibacter arilaitensis]PMQ21181.1 hypothetical protein CIK84_06330 [Glutamicibacter arilaitensis]
MSEMVVTIQFLRYVEDRAYVGYKTSSVEGQQVWETTLQTVGHRIHHEFIFLVFIFDNLGVWLRDGSRSIKLAASLPFSVTFKRLIEFLLATEPSIAKRVDVLSSDTTFVYPILPIEQYKLDPTELSVSDDSQFRGSTNLRLIQKLLRSLCESIGSPKPTGVINFPPSQIWTVQNTKGSVINGLPATESFLDSFERSLLSMCNMRVRFRNGLAGSMNLATLLSVSEEVFSEVASYSDDPAGFSMFWENCRCGPSGTASDREKAFHFIEEYTGLASDLAQESDNIWRSIISTLPSGLEFTINVLCREFGSNSITAIENTSETVSFWSKRGMAVLGANESSSIVWGQLLDDC